MSALLGGRRTATIRSVGKSIVKVFPGDKLLETLEGYPDISKQVITSLVARLEDTNKRLVEVINAKTDMERTLKAVAPHAAGQVASRIPFGRAAAGGGGGGGGAPKPTASQFRARTGGGGGAPSGATQTQPPKPLRKPGDQTQTIRIASKAPQAKPVKEAAPKT